MHSIVLPEFMSFPTKFLLNFKTQKLYVHVKIMFFLPILEDILDMFALLF